MKYEFQSVLKDSIQGLIEEKRSLGYKYETALKNLRRLDRLAVEKELKVPTITREFAEDFIRITPNEKPINSTHRVGIIRVLAEYMNRHGLDAYVIPPLPIGSYKRSFTPHIYTDEELKRLFLVADNYATSPSLDGQMYSQREKYPLILRILYSTGMRIGEVLSLKVESIDFSNNTFTILQAKNGSERIIPVHDNTIDMLRKYILKNEIFEREEYIFANRDGNHISARTISHVFLEFLSMAKIPHPKGGPRIHDFRHTFCVHRLRDWILEGKDINALFPYLCAYMGHADTRCTEYYLRLTADLYPDIISKSEKYFKGDCPDE